MDVLDILNKKQWYEDPNLFSSTMQSKQQNLDEAYRQKALTQQKELSERQMTQQEKQFQVQSEQAGLTQKVGMFLSTAESKRGIDKFLQDNPLLTKPVETLTFQEKQQRQILEKKHNNMLYYHNAIVNKSIDLANAIDEILNPTKATIPEKLPFDTNRDQLKFRSLE